MVTIRSTQAEAMNGRSAVSKLIDSIPALVAYVDCNMVLQYCNQPFRSWFELNDDVDGQPLSVVIGKEIFHQLQRHMGRVLVGARTHFQISATTDRGVQYLDATLSPDVDDKQVVTGFIFHGSDVTEKNKNERALKDYFENASIGLHWVDVNGIIRWANPAEMKMLGYCEDEYIGHHISEFHADKNVIVDILTRLKNKEGIENYDVDLLCKNGAVRHATLNSTALWDDERFVHTRCFTVDVTEQKRALTALKESEERFRMIANLVPLVIWTTDAKGDCNFLSNRWIEFTGHDIASGLGSNWLALVHPDDRQKIQDSWHASLSAKRNFDAKFRLRNAAGGYTTTYANLKPRSNAAGEFSGHIGIMQDVSIGEQIMSSLEKMVLERTEDLRKKNEDLKRAEEALQEKNAKLEEINGQLSSFAHVASHDLQEPLRKIQTYTARLYEIEGGKFSEKGKELFERIYRSSDRMKNLIQDILTYSRTNRSQDTFEPIDLNSLLDEVIGELEVKIHEKNARIENRGLPCINAIRFQLHQMFLNLLSNALKFSKDGEIPHIIISSELVEAEAVPMKLDTACRRYHHISVADNGIGFEPAAGDRIFEIFHRLHSRSAYEGTGIGLAICKKIAENHRGGIMAEGKLNAGATFHIYFPAC